MGQYFLAAWLAILIQFVLTKLFAQFINYLIANIVAIILAAIFTYIFNDIWTFSIKKPERRKQRAGL
jgi:dolichol-phosphate mannosyltransferase